MYIVVEGLDYSGKTHLINQLKNNIECVTVKEPFNEDYVSKKIRESIQADWIPQTHETVILLSGRIELFKKYNYIINDDKRILLSDRSFITSMVYQHDYRNNFLKIMNLNLSALHIFESNPIPDILIYMDTPFDKALEYSGGRDQLDNKDKKVLTKYNYEKMSALYKTSITMVKQQDKDNKMNVIYLKPDYDIEDLVLQINDILNKKETRNDIDEKDIVNFEYEKDLILV